MIKQKIAIVCGGPSSEHEISCLSAGGVLKGLDPERFDSVLIGITKEGKWVLLPNDYPLLISGKSLPQVMDNDQNVELTTGGFSCAGQFIKIDCVFPVLHGEFGEDGKIQQLLESVQLAYVGSGVQASAQAMDKDLAKQAFVAVGMSVAEGFAVSQNDWKEKTSNIQYPVFVKPSSGGSSRGTHKVKSNDDLQMALEDAFLYDSKVLIESAVIGREIECAVLERNGSLEASMPGEIVVDPKFEFYDFEAKYLDNATTVKVPANISELDSAEIRRLAMKAFRSLSCSGLARCDFFYTNEGKIIINEVNTMPGFTGTSVYPKLWQASGVTYTELISTLIDSALQK